MSEMRPVPGAPGYFVTDDGDVFSDKRGARRCLRQTTAPHGYLTVALYVNRVQRLGLVHRLVCEAFHGPPAPGQEVRHLDGIKSHNSANNLAWGTRRENMADKRAHGTAQIGARNPLAKLTDECVVAIRARAAAGETQTSIAQDYGVSQRNLSQIVIGATWGHVSMPDMRDRVTRRGEKHAHAKLTEAAVVHIRSTLGRGTTARDLASKYGVTEAAVYYAARGDTWAHVKQEVVNV